MAGKLKRFTAESRVSVQVVLLDSTSTSPEASAGNRLCVVTGTNSTFDGSPKMVMAMARQISTLKPCQRPWLSGTPKPGLDGPCTPQRSVPRCLI